MLELLSAKCLEAYYGSSQVLHDIRFSVRRGEQIALIGRNGMGKTTLLHSLIGLVADRRGSIIFEGQEIVAATPEKIAQMGVALVPEGRRIFGSLTVLENLVMAARPGRGGRRTYTLDHVFDLFPRLRERRSHGGHQLSGGEQQMLAIGRALMTNPDLILIDEATEGLAPQIAREIWRILEVMRDERIAAIVVDRDMRGLSRVVDQVLILSKGTIVFQDTPLSLREDPTLLEKHLGV
jgi:branched-chain amino acid transport system ATP-binding protein